MLCKHGLCRHVVSVCPSCSRILWKRINVSSNIFHRQVAKPFYVIHTKIFVEIFRRGPPNGIVECKNRVSRSTNSWLFINDCNCVNNCDYPLCSLPHTPPRISESLFITTSMDDDDEQSRISGKYEAEVTNDRILRSTYCNIEANC